MSEKKALIQEIKELRELTGASILDCRQALISGGSKERALEILKQQGYTIAEKRRHRKTTEGLVEAYVHFGGRMGAMVEVTCETDFVARTEIFKELCHDLALQVAAMNPKYLSVKEMPPGKDEDPREVCLLAQPFIKDGTITVEDRIREVISRTKENIVVRRFVRFELGRD